MKRLLSAALALALMSGTAAYADPFGPGHQARYDHGWGPHRGHGDGAAVAVGLGLLALTAIVAASQRDRERAQSQYYDPPPPGYRPDNRGYDGPAYGPNERDPGDRYPDDRQSDGPYEQ